MAIFEARTSYEKKEEYNKKFIKLIGIYENKKFDNALDYDFPTRSKYNNDDANRRYLPKVLLGFGKYSQYTLYQIYIKDYDYFEWLFKEPILSFDEGTRNLSNKIRYSTEY